MSVRKTTLLTIGWISHGITGLAILVFGFVGFLLPDSFGDGEFVRAIGAASIGMGLFGLLISVIAYRRRERWAWFALWYYPVFWAIHLMGGLPPGKEHIHQVAFLLLSVAALILPVREFFPRTSRLPMT